MRLDMGGVMEHLAQLEPESCWQTPQRAVAFRDGSWCSL